MGEGKDHQEGEKGSDGYEGQISEGRVEATRGEDSSKIWKHRMG